MFTASHQASAWATRSLNPWSAVMVKQTSAPARRIPSRFVTQDWIDKRIASGVGQGVPEKLPGTA
jgi:hypothetical protein